MRETMVWLRSSAFSPSPMASDGPLVGIIVPTRNSARFLDACLTSIAAQTFKDTVLIVVDNNSTDDTKAIARRYTDKVFNCGPERSGQRNYGASQARAADVLLFVDSDMELTPRVVEECVLQINSNAAIRGVVIPEESIGTGFWARCKRLERSFYVGVDWMEAARCFERGAYLESGGFDEEMVAGEDWDLSQRIRAASPTCTLGRVPVFIRHNEGRLALHSLLRKKYYYAVRMRTYVTKHSRTQDAAAQTGVSKRYMLFLLKPRQLFHDPVVGIGMLLMKTSEFIAGALGLAAAYVTRR